MERPFLLLSFLFLIFFPVLFDCVYVSWSGGDLSESWQVDGKGQWKCNQVKRWVKSAQMFKETVVKKITSHLILCASEQTSSQVLF